MVRAIAPALTAHSRMASAARAAHRLPPPRHRRTRVFALFSALSLAAALCALPLLEPASAASPALSPRRRPAPRVMLRLPPGKQAPSAAAGAQAAAAVQRGGGGGGGRGSDSSDDDEAGGRAAAPAHASLQAGMAEWQALVAQSRRTRWQLHNSVFGARAPREGTGGAEDTAEKAAAAAATADADAAAVGAASDDEAAGHRGQRMV